VAEITTATDSGKREHPLQSRAVLRVQELSKAFGGRVLFDRLDLQLRPGDRVGLVGRNGAGKTTLLRILAGLDPADDGRIHTQHGVRIGYLRQEIDPDSDHSVMAEAMRALEPIHALERSLAEARARLAEHAGRGEPIPESLLRRSDELEHAFERAGGFSAEAGLRATLVGLGLGPEFWNRPLRELSGGWLMRVELARLLTARPEILLLDEPTNHLDVPSIRWFEGVLAAYPGSVLVVSHDRRFLDRHVNRIAELGAGRLTTYTGNYSDFERQRAARREQQEVRARGLEREIAHQQRFVERFGAKATKASQARSRKKAIERLQGEYAELGLEDPEPRRALRVRFECAVRPGEVALRLEGVRRGFGGTDVYRDLDLEILRAERVALVGPNGAGKTTLLRMLAGELEPDAGTVEPGHNVRRAFFAQHQVDALEPSLTALEQLEAVARIDDIPRLRSILGAFLFSGDEVHKPIRVLSGGEKSRLALARLLLEHANTLILDEPTNHLDMDAREALCAALADFEGTLVFVSHDRAFIDALCTRVIEVSPGAGSARIRSFPGSFADYERALDRESDAAQAVPELARTQRAQRPEANERRARERELRKLRARVGELEAEIEGCEARIAEIDAHCATPEVARDGIRMRELAQERRAREARLAQTYAAWEDAASALDAESPGETRADRTTRA
jgi:ATP-binding cassette subfamily F protein 3